MANEHILKNSLIVTGSITASDGFFGDGSGLTNITSTSEWDGSRNGNASITGSLDVSGSGAIVDFTNTSAISGSTFSGSFSGNGSGLTNLNINGITGNNLILSGAFSGSFSGDGSNLTGITIFPFTGSAVITGSLLVSGSNTTVNFVDVAAISGSIFSGSFVGDASGLTNLPETEWDGSRNGNASITGSFVVSGSSPLIDLKGLTTIDRNIEISNRGEDKSLGLGSEALPTSTILNRQAIALGHRAMRLQVSGSNSCNLAIGQCALASNVKGVNVIAIGACSLRNSVGLSSSGNINFSHNLAIGILAGHCMTIGRYNTILGHEALADGTGASNSVVIGYKAGKKNSTSNNVFIGMCSGQMNLGNNNTFLGYKTGNCSTTARCNVAIGDRALQSNSNNCLTGCCNVALGIMAGGEANKASSKNVYIGPEAGPSTGTIQSCQFYLGIGQGESPLMRGDFGTGHLVINTHVSASAFSGSFIGDGSQLTGVAGQGFPFVGDAVITGSLEVSQSLRTSVALSIPAGHVVLRQVSESLNFTKDSQAAAAGVPLGGLYRSGNFIAIRIE